MTTSAHPPISFSELGGSGLSGVRHLRDERERRRRARLRTHQAAQTSTDKTTLDGNAALAQGGQNIPRDPTHGAGKPAAYPSPRRTHVTDFEIDLTTNRRISSRQRRRMEETHEYLCANVDPIMGSLILALVSDRPTDIRGAALQYLLVAKKCGSGEPIISTEVMPPSHAGRTDKVVCDACCIIGASCQKHMGNRADHLGGDDGGHGGQNARNSWDSGGGIASNGEYTQGSVAKRLAQRQDRLFMASEIGPLITELINRTLRSMPTDVVSFLIEQLRGGETRAKPLTEEQVLKSGENSSNATHTISPSIIPRPSTARNRLQEAQNMDLEVQRSSPSRGERAERRSPSPPGRPRNALYEPEDKIVAEGVKESKNKPWDVEIASKATLPPSSAESLPPSALSKSPQQAVVLLLGIDGAGKSTLLGTLQGEHDPRVRPSVGFKPVTMMLSDRLQVKFYDLGGGRKIRSIWDKYYHDAHGLIYVVDGADAGRWEESKQLYLVSSEHKYLRGKPVAVILNKEDAGLQLDPEDVADELGFSSRNNVKVWCCSVNSARAKGGTTDIRLEGAVEWLLENIQGSFLALNDRVQRDLRDMEREFQEERERKQLAVLRGLLSKAFPELEGAEREDCFNEIEGLEFLTSEVGLEAGSLPAEGVEIAALVGYQKLALQMVGNMKIPISRKNRARSWEAIKQLILDLRHEIGIDK